MADFKTHVTTSSVIGIGLGASALFVFDFPLDQCLLGAGLCGLAGMLPDLDSPNSVPVRETVSLSAALLPILLLPRFYSLGLTGEQIVLVSAVLYFGFRFGIAEIFKRYTVHRGMWHSIPSALIAALVVLLICDCEVIQYRFFKGFAVLIGFISHLVLDELYSIDLSGARIRVKKSSGTALKFWGRKAWPNFSTYAKLFALLFLLMFDPMMMNAIGHQPLEVPHAAKEWLKKMAPEDVENYNPFKHSHADGHSHDEEVHEQRKIIPNYSFQQNGTNSHSVSSPIRSAPVRSQNEIDNSKNGPSSYNRNQRSSVFFQ